MKFFSWQSTVLFHLKRRVQNIKGYEKRKTQGKTKRSGLENAQDELEEKEVEELHALLLKEVQTKKRNYDAIKQIQENTFESRRRDIQERTKNKCVVSDIVANYLFFQVHECTVSNHLS